MQFHMTSLTSEKVEGKASISLNAADGIEFEAPPQDRHFKSYVLAAPDDTITTRIEDSLEDGVEEFVDLVIDGILRATSPIKKGRGKKHSNITTFDRVHHYRFDGDKKKGLKQGEMVIQLRENHDNEHSDTNQKIISLGTVELQLWRKYPDERLPEDVIAAWKDIPEGEAESRAGNFEEFPRWSNQSRNLATNVPQDFEIGFTGDMKFSQAFKDKILDPRPDFRLFTSVTFHLATAASVRELGFEDVPDYVSAAKPSSNKASTNSETASKKGTSAASKESSKPLPGASKKAQKGGEKTEKGDGSKFQAVSKSEQAVTGREPKKFSKSGKKALDDENGFTSDVIDLDDEGDVIMGNFGEFTDKLIEEDATERRNAKEAPKNMFTPVQMSVLSSGKNSSVHSTGSTSTGNGHSGSALFIPKKKPKPMSLRGIKGGPADKPPRSVLEAASKPGHEFQNDYEEVDLNGPETLIVVSPAKQGDIIETVNEIDVHQQPLSPPAFSKRATLGIADSRGHGTGLPPNDIQSKHSDATKLIPERVATPVFNKSLSSGESSTQSFNTSQERREAGAALQRCLNGIQTNFLERVETFQERKDAGAVLQGRHWPNQANLPEQAGNDTSEAVQLRTPPSPREGSFVSEATTEVADPKDIARAIAQFVPRTPKTAALTSPSSDFEQSQNSAPVADPSTPTHQHSDNSAVTGLGIHTASSENPDVFTSIEYTPNTTRGPAFLHSSSPALGGSALRDNQLRRDYQSESPTPSASRGRGIDRSRHRGSSVSKHSRRREPGNMDSIDARIHSPLVSGPAGHSFTSRNLSEKLPSPAHNHPSDSPFASVSPPPSFTKPALKRKAAPLGDEEEQHPRKCSALGPKEPPKRKAAALSDEKEQPQKFTMSSAKREAKREAEDINKRIADAQARLDAAKDKSNSLDEEEKAAFKVREMEEEAARLESENAEREATIERIYGDVKMKDS